MRRLEKLMVENNKLRRKTEGKKTKEGSTPHLKRMSPKKGRKKETIMISLPITQCLLIMIICLALPLILPYPLAKLTTLLELIIINESIA
jgi:hypothetical protein